MNAREMEKEKTAKNAAQTKKEKEIVLHIIYFSLS